jgi:hypothetical protein
MGQTEVRQKELGTTERQRRVIELGILHDELPGTARSGQLMANRALLNQFTEQPH